MDFDNKHDERRHWREERRRWRQERHRRWENYTSERWNDRSQSRSSGVWTGILLLLIGADYFLVENNVFPKWMWSWEVLLIAMGLFIGIRHNFRSPAWFILMVIGGVFLIKSDEFAKYFPGINLNNIWPIALIILGLFFILRPHRRHRYWHDQVNDHVKSKIDEAFNGHSEPSEVKGQQAQAQSAPSFLSEDFIDSTSIFGGVKKNIISKNFKGGDITNIMGGSEIDLTQADINGTVSIDLTQVFGGTKLIVPSNWQVKAQMAAIFGGVEDKRSIQNTALDPNKILILDGTSIFGGIEIRSY